MMTALLIVNPSDVVNCAKRDSNSISGKKEERMGRLKSEDRGLDEGSRGRQGYEVVDMLKRRQAALGLSKMRVLDLGFLDCH